MSEHIKFLKIKDNGKLLPAIRWSVVEIDGIHIKYDVILEAIKDEFDNIICKKTDCYLGRVINREEVTMFNIMLLSMQNTNENDINRYYKFYQSKRR